MARRRLVDHRLHLETVPVEFINGARTTATAEGNKSGWVCLCGTQLVWRCYYQFGDTCHTRCSGYGRQFRVLPDGLKRASKVIEEAPAQPMLVSVG